MDEVVIKAEHLETVLVARRIARFSSNVTGRWAAMSSHRWTGRGCRRLHRSEADCFKAYPMPPTMQPMSRGSMARVVQRTRDLHGLEEVRRVWRSGLRVLLAEMNSEVMR